MEIKALTREQAIKSICELFERYFGVEKGSAEMYQDFAEDLKLCEPWDGEGEYKKENMPPDYNEFLLALGVKPQEIIDITHINTKCFDENMCKMYGVEIPKDTL